MTTIKLPEAPACTTWCSGHTPRPADHPQDGWDDIDGNDVTKVCRRAVPLEGDLRDDAPEVSVERWALYDSLRDTPQVEICPPVVSLHYSQEWDEISPEVALQLAAAITTAVRLALPADPTHSKETAG